MWSCGNSPGSPATFAAALVAAVWPVLAAVQSLPGMLLVILLQHTVPQQPWHRQLPEQRQQQRCQSADWHLQAGLHTDTNN